MDYLTAQDYLYSLGHETLAMKLGLENIHQLVEALGRPDKSYASIHIAGTNGKGSLSAILATIAYYAHIPTGLFTSPHLIDLTERFQFNLAPITPLDFAQSLATIKNVVDLLLTQGTLTTRPTFFEHVTAVAIDYFQKQAAQLAIMEVGLGGRLDSTNIIEPILSIITSVDLDHQQYLGNSLAEIAREKAGILKPGVPALISPQAPAALATIQEVAQKVGSPLIYLNPQNIDYHPEPEGFWSFDLQTAHYHYQRVKLGLRGRHQVVTAALAILAAEHLAQKGWPISPTMIRQGIGQVYWPGRLEVLGEKPWLLLDGAHNPGGIKTLANFLSDWTATTSFSTKVLLFSVMRDKDYLPMLTMLSPYFDQIILVERPDPRSLRFEDLPREKLALTPLSVAKDVQLAWQQAQQYAGSEGLIVAAGSLHLIGDIKALLKTVS